METQALLPFARKRRDLVEQRADGWWAVGLPDNDTPEIGPYDTAREAREGRRGVMRFFACNPEYADKPLRKRGAR